MAPELLGRQSKGRSIQRHSNNSFWLNTSHSFCPMPLELHSLTMLQWLICQAKTSRVPVARTIQLHGTFNWYPDSARQSFSVPSKVMRLATQWNWPLRIVSKAWRVNRFYLFFFSWSLKSSSISWFHSLCFFWLFNFEFYWTNLLRFILLKFLTLNKAWPYMFIVWLYAAGSCYSYNAHNKASLLSTHPKEIHQKYITVKIWQ